MIRGGQTLGVLGGGQLGMFFVLAAQRHGYPVWVLDPDPHCPAARTAARHLCAPLDDPVALEEFTRGVAAVTVESENIPAATLAHCAAWMRPGPEAVRIAQDRRLEKSFLRDLDLPVAPFIALDAGTPLPPVTDDFPFPALLKTARWGYDGKGQETVVRGEDLAAAWQALGTVDAVLEARVDLAAEFSILLARGEDGMVVFYPAAYNYHRDGILDLTLVCTTEPTAMEAEARHMALRIAEALDYIGVLAVEFFVDGHGEILVNELAPRPHNSGHFSLDASIHSQFDQQLRCLCGLPLGDTRLLSPVAMMNLLGDLWNPQEPDWSSILEHPQIKLWLYGKREARPRRKMGHLTILPEHSHAIAKTVAALRRSLALPDLPPLGFLPECADTGLSPTAPHRPEHE